MLDPFIAESFSAAWREQRNRCLKGIYQPTYVALTAWIWMKRQQSAQTNQTNSQTVNNTATSFCYL